MNLTLIVLPIFFASSVYQGVESDALGDWIVKAAAVAVLVLVFINLFDRLRGGSLQKREVSFSAGYASKQEHDKLRADYEDGIEKLHKRIDDIPSRTIALLKDTKQLHNK